MTVSLEAGDFLAVDDDEGAIAERGRLQYEGRDPVAGDGGADRGEAGRRTGGVEQPLARADHHREHHQTVDIYQAGLVQRPGQLRAAVDLELFPGLLLQVAD